jgi:hypothetical protein
VVGGIYKAAATLVTISAIDNRERKDKNLQLLSRIKAYLDNLKSYQIQTLRSYKSPHELETQQAGRKYSSIGE